MSSDQQSPSRGSERSADLTLLLAGMKAGDPACRAGFIEAVYGSLKRMAAAQLRSERPHHTLQPSALVNELYVQMLATPDAGWENRAHFFAVAASRMRCILVDYARKQRALKRQGALKRVDLSCPGVIEPNVIGPDRLIALDIALDELAKLDPRQARIVEMRYFAGLTFDEVAMIIGVSSRTIKRDWTAARAWLIGRMRGERE